MSKSPCEGGLGTGVDGADTEIDGPAGVDGSAGTGGSAGMVSPRRRCSSLSSFQLEVCFS